MSAKSVCFGGVFLRCLLKVNTVQPRRKSPGIFLTRAVEDGITVFFYTVVHGNTVLDEADGLGMNLKEMTERIHDHKYTNI